MVTPRKESFSNLIIPLISFFYGGTHGTRNIFVILCNVKTKKCLYHLYHFILKCELLASYENVTFENHLDTFTYLMILKRF